MLRNLLFTLLVTQPDFDKYGLVESTKDLRKQVVDKLMEAEFFWLAVAVAGIGATIYTAKTCASIMNGQQFDIWELLKPLAMCLLCVNFRLVISVLDFVPNGVSNVTAEIINIESKAHPRKDKEIFNSLQEELNKEDEKKLKEYGIEGAKTAEGVTKNIQTAGSAASTEVSTSGEVSGNTSEDQTTKNVEISKDSSKKEHPFWDKVKGFLANTYGTVCDFLVGSLAQSILTVMDFVFPLIIAVSQVMLAILAFLGPFVLAFSVFPGFGGFKSWCARYLHTAFWMPITYILHYIYVLGLNTFSGFTPGDSIGQYTDRVGAMLIFGLAMFVNIFRVPTMSSYIVESAMSSGLAGAPGKARAAAGKLLNKSNIGRLANGVKKIVAATKNKKVG